MSSWKDRIASDPARGHGAPCVRSTRVPVSTVVGSLGGGMSFAEGDVEPHRGPVSVPEAPDRFGVATVSVDFLCERAQPEVDRRDSL